MFSFLSLKNIGFATDQIGLFAIPALGWNQAVNSLPDDIVAGHPHSGHARIGYQGFLYGL